MPVTKQETGFKGMVVACCHRVAFHYWDFDTELTVDVEERLQDEAEERATDCINEGCSSGDLNCLYVDDAGNEEEIRGWWQISTD